MTVKVHVKAKLFQCLIKHFIIEAYRAGVQNFLSPGLSGDYLSSVAPNISLFSVWYLLRVHFLEYRITSWLLGFFGKFVHP